MQRVMPANIKWLYWLICKELSINPMQTNRMQK